MPYSALIPEQAAKKRAYDAARYAEKCDAIKARTSAWYENNRLERLAKLRSDRAQIAIAAGRQPHKVGAPIRLSDEDWINSRRANVRNYRAGKRRAAGKHSAADVKCLVGLQNGKCAFCLTDLPTRGFHVDHYVPISKGGTNDRSNLKVLCAGCNLKKNALDPIEFAHRHGLLIW